MIKQSFSAVFLDPRSINVGAGCVLRHLIDSA